MSAMARGVGRQVTCVSVFLFALAACGNQAESAAGLREAARHIAVAQVSTISVNEVAETFAMGTKSTDVQRADLTERLRGSVVEWTIPVYEVTGAEAGYVITSQPIPIGDTNALNLVHIGVLIVPLDDLERQQIKALKTGDTVRIKGLVQDVVLRVSVQIAPGILVRSKG